MCDVCNMYSDLIVAVFKAAERQCVIEVLCIGRVNGKCEHIAEIPASGQILRCYFLRNLIGRIGHCRLEAVRKGVFGENGMHLRVIFSRFSEYIDDMSSR